MNKVDMLKQMLESSPDSPNIWYLLGCEYREQGDSVSALQAFSRALGNSDEQLRAEINKELIAMASREPVPTANHDDLLDDVDLNAAEKVPIAESPVMRPFTVIAGGKAGTTQDEVETRSVTFADVGGLDDLKKTIEMKIIKPFVTPGLFERFKKKSAGVSCSTGLRGVGKPLLRRTRQESVVLALSMFESVIFSALLTAKVNGSYTTFSRLPVLKSQPYSSLMNSMPSGIRERNRRLKSYALSQTSF